MLMNGVRGDSRMWEALWEANGVTFDLDVEDAGKKDAAGDPHIRPSSRHGFNL
jgi:hypothetical protein